MQSFPFFSSLFLFLFTALAAHASDNSQESDLEKCVSSPAAYQQVVTEFTLPENFHANIITKTFGFFDWGLKKIHGNFPQMTILKKGHVLAKVFQYKYAEAYQASDFIIALAELETSDTLISLPLSSGSLSTQAIQALASSPHFGGLRILDFQGFEVDTNEISRLIFYSTSLQSLRTVCLKELTLGDAYNIANSPILSQLTTLSLTRLPYADERARIILNSPNLQEITTVDLRYQQGFKYAKKSQWLDELNNL